MKKQILFLILLAAAVLLGPGKSYAQSGTEVDYLDNSPNFCPTATTLTCTGLNALSPAPGVAYDYTVTVSSSSTIHWFVTTDPNVMTGEGKVTTAIEPATGGNYVLAANAAYNDPSQNSATVNITWKSFDGTANQVLLVAYAVDADGCTDNLEVYRIIPEYNFTLDIAGILDDGNSGATECVAPVQGATYNGTDLEVDYGVNYVFFAVNAANWQTSWQTNLVATTDGTSDLGAPEWAYPADATTTGVWNANGTEVLATSYASNNNGFIGSGGECIIVRVPVTHTSTENITSETINLVVNGEMINASTGAYDGVYPDLEEVNESGAACASDMVTDNANYVITPRPDINESSPSPFENKTPRD
ncbi:hypothetical protein [Mangrovibacterium diazotrophicum]|uniref:Ig-like domain-containing protein n=1 Tax=Mangrovibacterium diazotrophicum TaxID=1261403 RepID=A0A419W8T1_9BACT|nr:hypothetical protein [Mangrovibacterium diazotrophicum]RKD91792.1 hypothetical protein BC643_2158 [Mangrovibacterium diazotrophicum]